jgi:hypothetical protein
VWVSGFGGGGEAQPSLTIKQLDHGTNATESAPALASTDYVFYRVLGAENAIWEDLEFKVDGVVCELYDSTNTSMTGGVEAGHEFYAVDDGDALIVDIGDSVLIRHDPSNKIILEIQVSTA